MQILIISLPSGEQVTSLNHTIDASETLIGQSDSCQILLPDQQESVAARHARIFREDDHWYLENISKKNLSVNATEIRSGSRQRYLLNDGDIISCGEYRLMVSDFSPWQTSTLPTLETPSQSNHSNDSPEFCVIPSQEYLHLDDPFEQQVTSDIQQNTLISNDLSMQTHTSHNTTPDSQPPLIDILADESEDDDEDWSINRHLWTDYQENDVNVPVLADVALSNAAPQQKDLIKADKPHRRSVCQAMLKSLELLMQDMSPESLTTRFNHFPAESDNDYEAGVEAGDYWKQYQKLHHQMMTDQNYRLLFLHRFRQALKQQENH
ncbi:hypothetical protein ACH42_16510 [Endozoicomonas sp. (ex Bugula neritina AB1)]|nr:hypothetical protein ACH42_16510 [Endozoicomonas sp. (ex Bugula neritina AB1)]